VAAPSRRLTIKKPAAVIEVGAAAERSLTEGQSSFGPTAAVEFTPLENWLELEAGVTPLFRRHSTEWTTDLLFKKPWMLSDRNEFMLGVGPEWIHTNACGIKQDSVGVEVARTSCSGHPKSIDSVGIWNRRNLVKTKHLGAMIGHFATMA
jgi:hypothetical protein